MAVWLRLLRAAASIVAVTVKVRRPPAPTTEPPAVLMAPAPLSLPQLEYGVAIQVHMGLSRLAGKTSVTVTPVTALVLMLSTVTT